MTPLNQYYDLARNHGRFLAFGFLMAFTSSAGQTYFIGIFGPEIRVAFSLSHTEWGSIYLAGTLCSALVLAWSGQLIDRTELWKYTAVVIAGLGARLFGLTVGLLAGFAVAGDPFGVFFSNLLLTETLFTTALCITWWLAWPLTEPATQ